MDNKEIYNGLSYGLVTRTAEIAGLKHRNQVHRALIKGEGENIDIVREAALLAIAEKEKVRQDKLQEIAEMKMALS